MKCKFRSGPLHNQILEVGTEPPPGWMAPKVPLDRHNNEPEFRPVVGPWDDPSAPRRFDLYEYERAEQAGETIYHVKTLHRADGSKLNF